jgi:hypothetical protein
LPLGKGGNRISKKNAGLPDTLNSKEGLVGGVENLLFNLGFLMLLNLKSKGGFLSVASID